MNPGSRNPLGFGIIENLSRILVRDPIDVDDHRFAPFWDSSIRVLVVVDTYMPIDIKPHFSKVLPKSGNEGNRASRHQNPFHKDLPWFLPSNPRF